MTTLPGRATALRPVLEATVAALAVIALLGFRTFGADHFQYLLHARRAAQPGFALNDWFIDRTESYHYTFSAAAEIAIRHGWLEPMLATWFVLTTLALAVGITALVRAFGGGSTAVAVAMVVTLAAARSRGWGDLVLVAPDALPHYLGTALGVVVLAAVVSRRPWWLVSMLLLTAYVHVNVGMWVGFLAMLWVVVDRAAWRDRSWRPALAALVVGGIPLLLTVLGDFLSGAAVPPDTFDTLLYGRAPHHYVPVGAPFEQHAMMGTLMAAGIVAAAGTTRYRRHLAAVAVGSVVVMALALLGAGPLDWPLPVRLFPFRLVPLLTVLLISILSVRAVRGALPAAVTLGGLAVSVLWPGLALGLAVTGGLMAMSPLRSPSGSGRMAAGALVTVGAAVALHAQLPIHPGYRTALPTASSLQAAVREHTAPGEVLLVDPAVGGLRWFSERAIVVDYKVFPLDGPGMADWRERMLAVTGLDPAAADRWLQGGHLAGAYSAAYDRRPLVELLHAGDAFGASALLVEHDSRAAEDARTAGSRLSDVGSGYVLIEAGGRDRGR